jgi:hypothetical protein
MVFLEFLKIIILSGEIIKVIKDKFSGTIYLRRGKIHILGESILVASNNLSANQYIYLFFQSMNKKDNLKKRKQSRKYYFVLYQQSNLVMRDLDSILEAVDLILNFNHSINLKLYQKIRKTMNPNFINFS